MSKKFTCNKKYIVLPASFHAQKKRLLFYIDDKLVFDLVVSLDYDAPDYEFPVNVERFMGKDIRVECDCDIDIRFDMTDEPVTDYSGKYRPYVHFTAKRGWINDPNGLVYHNGKFLMYFQHNPAATTWENMHWGCAVSDDLMHWSQNEDVLFPDENGTIFSGSGIVDYNNISGLGKDKEIPILFFYTCAGSTSEASKGKPFTQNLAYSLDGGKTLIRYDRPLIEQIDGGNRDPKVIYYAKDCSYIMALFLKDHEFALFKSKNLLDWNEIQRITLPEDAECPDFYPLTVEGETKWVFSAASDRYYIGNFDGRKYTPETKQLRINYGNNSYAAQSWSDVCDGRRIRTAFATVVIPGMPFGSCMNIPQNMTLKKVNGELRLCAEPVKEIENLYLDTKCFENVTVSRDNSFKTKLNSKACDVKIKLMCHDTFEIDLFGLHIAYDAKENILRCADKEAPVGSEDKSVELRIIYDTVYAEIFANSGSVFMGMTYIQDSVLDKFTVSSDNAVIEKLVISEMGRYYER